ncbi:MAG: membrane fusion protein MtrC [Alphaproteobacteria bacterium]|nr:membrane fusion protein MtrC [Alphaproteobacteria bacterium]
MGLVGRLVGGAVATVALAMGAVASDNPGGGPATLSGQLKESDLNTITLTAEAEKRLGLVFAKAETRKVVRTRTLGGDVIVPNGSGATARYAATASMSASDLAQAQIDADGAVTRARVARDNARTRHERAKKLFEAKNVSERALDDAKAELDTAEAALKTAQSQRALLGQSIAATEAPRRIWIKASVYVGDLARLDLTAPARVHALAVHGKSLEVKPVSAPMMANAQAAIASIFYEGDNPDGAFRMGERVNVDVPTTGQTDALTVPWSAVLYDVQGGEWVYARLADHVFARKRVLVRAVVGDTAVLALGPPPGTEVVATGSPELFGTEFGVAH